MHDYCTLYFDTSRNMSEQIYCKTIRYFSAFMNEEGGEDMAWEETMRHGSDHRSYMRHGSP